MAAHAHIHNSLMVVDAASWIMAKNFSAIIKKREWKFLMKSYPDVLDDIHEKLAKTTKA